MKFCKFVFPKYTKPNVWTSRREGKRAIVAAFPLSLLSGGGWQHYKKQSRWFKLTVLRFICYSNLTNCLWVILKTIQICLFSFLFFFFFWDSAPYRTHRIISNPRQKTTIPSSLVLEMKVCKLQISRSSWIPHSLTERVQWNRTDLTLERATLYMTYVKLASSPP